MSQGPDDAPGNILEPVLSDVCTSLGPRNDPVRVPLGPVTRSRAKLFKESLQALVRVVQDQHGVHKDIEGLEKDHWANYTLIQAHDDSSGSPRDSAE